MVAVFLTCSAVDSVHAQVPGVVPDLSIWVNTWFKVTAMKKAYHFENIGVKPTPAYPESGSGEVSYVKITDWDTSTPGEEFLVVDVYGKESGSWNPIPVDTLNIYYFAGSNLKFMGTAQKDDPTGTSLNLVFVFTGKRNKTNTKFITDGTTKLGTMGSSMFEIDDVPGSTERWAGSFKLSGPMVPVSKLPPPTTGAVKRKSAPGSSGKGARKSLLNSQRARRVKDGLAFLYISFSNG
jgi:hypothetical protein